MLVVVLWKFVNILNKKGQLRKYFLVGFIDSTGTETFAEESKLAKLLRELKKVRW